jgi:hypothetical protein
VRENSFGFVSVHGYEARHEISRHAAIQLLPQNFPQSRLPRSVISGRMSERSYHRRETKLYWQFGANTKPVTSMREERKLWSLVRVSCGNFLEMYDFQVFGYYASAIARTFFPSGNEFASLMFSLATFDGGFLMRPLGAIVLGTYIDRRGR